MNENNPSIEALYWKTWALLVCLPMFSIAAYLTGNRPLAMFTAMVVTLVGTYVATTVFMHLSVEPRFIPYLCLGAVAVMVLFFVMVSPDVLKHDGQHWVNIAAQQNIQSVEQAQAAHPGAE